MRRRGSVVCCRDAAAAASCCRPVAMDWRSAGWAGPLLLLLLLSGPGVRGQHEEDYFALGHDYPHDTHDYLHDGHDYYSDLDYGNYEVFVPNVANATLRKCRCDADQVWDGTTCQDVVTFVAIIDYWSKQRVSFNTSEFRSVVVGEVRCPAGHKKVVLDSNKGSVSEFSLLETGEVYWRDVRFPDYCIDHILDPNGEPKSWMAHLCLAPPPVSLCCPEGHALLTNGTCYPEDDALNVPLSIEVEGQLLTWEVSADSVVTNLTCSPADTYYRRLSEANVSLVYDPRGVMLQWLPPTLTNRPMDRQEYCVGVEVDGPGHAPQYATLFCYKDRAAQHRELCHNATCVRKCCDEHSLMSGVECVNAHGIHREWTPTFHHLGSLSPGAPPPEDLTLVHGLPICDSTFKMRPDESEEDRYYLLEDGTLMVPSFSKAYPPTMYCLDNFIAHDHPLQEHPLICFDDSPCSGVRYVAYPALLVISCVFLSITLLVYVSVPELHAKVHGKCLVSHVTALLIAYLCLIAVQLAGGRLPDGACKLMGQ